MTDVFSPEQRSAVMRAVKGQNTGPERAVRKLLTGLGLLYRLHHAHLPGVRSPKTRGLLARKDRP